VRLEDAIGLARAKRAQGYRIVFTNGCFDLFHAGHLEILKCAAGLGDILIVGVNSDKSVGKLKPGRPVVPEKERLAVVESLRWVDGAVLFSSSTPVPLIEMLKPDIHVKGGDWKKEDMPETAVVESYGGEVVIIPHRVDISTTKRLEVIREAS